jgi:hypothetical protein
MQDDKRIGLAELIGNLRRELIKAQQQSNGEAIRFLVEEVEVEVQVTSSKEATSGAEVEFWVVNAKADGKISTEAVQTLRLKLKPQTGAGDVVVTAIDNKPSD